MIKHAIFGNILLGTFGAAALVINALPAQAGEVHNRLENQQDRIAQGVSSGQLTFGEYRSVENHVDAINAQRERDLRNDGGHLTPAQSHQLNRELNNNSERIYFDKHNLRKQ
jgi:hypothetical protein